VAATPVGSVLQGVTQAVLDLQQQKQQQQRQTRSFCCSEYKGQMHVAQRGMLLHHSCVKRIWTCNGTMRADFSMLPCTTNLHMQKSYLAELWQLGTLCVPGPGNCSPSDLQTYQLLIILISLLVQSLLLQGH
jgi:hypothetical protein